MRKDEPEFLGIAMKELHSCKPRLGGLVGGKSRAWCCESPVWQDQEVMGKPLLSLLLSPSLK